MSRFLVSRLAKAGLESAPPDGVVKMEREHVWLLRGIDMAQLEKLASRTEVQEQWSVMADGANLRVRAINNTEFIMTGKTWEEGTDGKKEVEELTNAAMFAVFKRVASSGMFKKRYFVEWQGHTFEVDIFYNDGDMEAGVAPWCKIDLEVRDMALPIPVLPFTAEEIIKDNPCNRPPELEQVVPMLYKRYFTITR